MKLPHLSLNIVIALWKFLEKDEPAIQAVVTQAMAAYASGGVTALAVLLASDAPEVKQFVVDLEAALGNA
jgi:hypothetical protein